MKYLFVFLVLGMTHNSFGQAPEGFKYQAVVRDAGNVILNNQAVGMRLTIQQGSVGGTAVYTETFAPTTNAYGLVNLEIGTGTTTDDFTTIDWANGPYFMETAVDYLGGMAYVVMGTSQLRSVPYSLYAKTAENTINDAVDDADNDPTNEIETWATLSGIPADFSDNVDNVDDSDNDPTNEIETWATLSGIPADFSDNVDNVDDSDNDPTNEIQTISKAGTIVTLSNGGGTFEDSVGIYTAGNGIEIINNVVSTDEPTYTVGLWPELGGYVFWVSTDGKHGIVAETQDQSTNSNWYVAQSYISAPINHSVDGQKFRDWRLPTLYELSQMYLHKAAIGGFSTNYYWSSTEYNYSNANAMEFLNGSGYNGTKNINYYLRSVRTF